MKLKTIVLLTLSAFVFSGCGHFRHKGGCCSCKTEAKKDCSSGECSMDKKCGGCQKNEEKASK